MRAQDVMTHHVVCVNVNDSLKEAVDLMLRHRVSGLPVLDDSGQVAGMLTEGDLLRRVETGTERHRPRWLEFLAGPGKLAEEYTHTHGRRVKEVMSDDVVTVPPGKPLEEVVRLMEKRRIKRVPVIADGKLVGIVSRSNLVHVLGAVLHEIGSPAENDKAIADRMWHTLKATPWGPRADIDIIVRDGVVHLNGVLLNNEEIQALSVMAENIPGVKEVRNHVAFCDPMSGMILSPPDDSALNGSRTAA
jgi:CBS domain-containing protein